MDNSPVKKIARFLGLAAPLLALASCGAASNSDSYVAPAPVTVSFYDDSAEPQLVGYGYCIAGDPVDLRLSADYDFLSHDEAAQKALENGEYLSFVGWAGTYDDGTAVDLSSVTADCSVYASFEKDVYSVDFRYYNGTSLVRVDGGEFPSAVESSFEWGAFAGDFAVDYATLVHEEASSEFGKQYTCEGFTFRGYPGSGTFKDFGELASSLDIEAFIDERGQRDYRLCLLDPSLKEGRHEIGLLSSHPVVDLAAVYAEEDAMHKVVVRYGDEVKETYVRHGAGLKIASLIDENGNYRLSLTNEAEGTEPIVDATASVEDNLGKELVYRAVYAEGSAPHLVGNPVDLATVYGPAEIDIGLYETTHQVNVYDSDLSGQLIGTYELPSGLDVTVALEETADEYAVKVTPDAAEGETAENVIAYSLKQAGIASIEPAVRATPMTASLYGVSPVNAGTDGAYSFTVTADTDFYCQIEGEYDLVISYEKDGQSISQAIDKVTSDIQLLTGEAVAESQEDGMTTYAYPYEYGFHSGRIDGLAASGLSWTKNLVETDAAKEVVYTLA